MTCRMRMPFLRSGAAVGVHASRPKCHSGACPRHPATLHHPSGRPWVGDTEAGATGGRAEIALVGWRLRRLDAQQHERCAVALAEEASASGKLRLLFDGKGAL